MSFAGHAFVDWDDTIAENIRHFHEVEASMAALIARLTGSDTAEVLQRGEELDVIVSRRIGLVRAAMGMAWVECYHEFAHRFGVTAEAAVAAQIRQACLHPYDVRQDLVEGAADTLGWLRQAGFEITIWTAGEPETQGRKIDQSGLGDLIHRRVIVLDKTPDRLRTALAERDPGRSFVVGNSIHSDILPALQLGLPAFHIPVETWAYDRGQIDLTDPNYHRLDRITDLPPLLSGRFKLAV